MVIVSGKLKISAAALAVLLAVFFLDAALLVWVLAAAAAHECGHALALLIFRARVAELRVEPWGFEMTVEGPLSYGKEIAAAAAGPAASLLFAALLSPAGRFFALPVCTSRPASASSSVSSTRARSAARRRANPL
jgi:hypothetical protein